MKVADMKARTPTDRELLLDMFSRAGIVINKQWDEAELTTPDDGLIDVYAWGREGPQRGYSGFVASFGFNEDDSLKFVGAWE